MQPEYITSGNRRVHIALHTAGFIISMLAIFALFIVTADTGFTVLAGVLIALGFLTSWHTRTRAISAKTAASIRLLVTAGTLAAVALIPNLRMQILTMAGTDYIYLGFGTVIGCFLIIYSFNLVTNAAVAFLCIPALSLLGVATCTRMGYGNVEIFAIFLAFSTFLVAAQNTLSKNSSDENSIKWLRSHAAISLAITLIALLAGATIGNITHNYIDSSISKHIVARGIGAGLEQFTAKNFVPVATGPAPSSDMEVMTVQSPRAMLWRGQIFDKYLGHGWTQNSTGAFATPAEKLNKDAAKKTGLGELYNMPVYRLPEEKTGLQRTSTTRVEQTFQISVTRFRIIFAAAEPEMLTFSKPHNIYKGTGGLFTGTTYGKESCYTVISAASTATPDQLRAAPRKYPAQIKERYTITPESCRETGELARRITAGMENPYNKAIALQSYLEEHYTYDLSARPIPRNQDAVNHFLFKSKRGYCDIFASSMVIMAREVGIPARWVTGFATGEYSGIDNRYHVRFKDMHAWAELYFPDYGWIPFDPAARRINQHPIIRLKFAITQIRSLLLSNFTQTCLALLILLLVGYILKTEVLGRLRHRSSVQQGTGQQHNLEAVNSYRRMCMLLARLGLPKEPSSTPYEYAGQVAAAFGGKMEGANTAVETVTAGFIRARYSGRPMPEEITASMASALLALRDEIRQARAAKNLPGKKELRSKWQAK